MDYYRLLDDGDVVRKLWSEKLKFFKCHKNLTDAQISELQTIIEDIENYQINFVLRIWCKIKMAVNKRIF